MKAKGVANRDHVVAYPQAVRIPHGQLGKANGIDLDDGEIGIGICPDGLGIEAAPIRERDRNRFGILDDVVVGEDEAFRCIDDRAGTYGRRNRSVR